ncbi:MAG: hemolysin family protein [Bacteroidota bacterium]
MNLSLILLIICFLALSALFSGSEIAFISSSKLRVELKRKSGSRRGQILANFFDHPAHFLGTMLVGNNIALVVFTFLMNALLTPFSANLFDSEPLQLLLNTIITTIVVLIFGEFLPKTIFRLFADNILFFLAYPLRFLQFLLGIPSWLMTKLSNFLLKYVLKTPVEKVDNAFTRVDLAHFIEASFSSDTDEEIDKELFQNALEFRQVKVKECMVPRTEIQAIEGDASIEDLLKLFQSSKLSRILVTDGDMDNILGYVHHQQMLTKPQQLSDMVLNIPFVPEVMRVQEVMNRFIRDRVSIACVVDEFGGTAGIITLEDIVEEIFGEIVDEHDQEDYIEQQISDTEFLFSGRLEIDYLNEKYESLQLPEGEYHTLSGYLVTTTETIPQQGIEIELENYRFILELVSDTKIETIRVVKLLDN